MKLFDPYNKRTRSASMQLSINAIVILVMAMAVLGLGLGLIRGVLGSGKTKLLDAMDNTDITEVASADKPITNVNNLALQLGKENPIIVGFYNADTDCSGTNGATLAITCLDSTNAVKTMDCVSLSVDTSKGSSTKVGAICQTKLGTTDMTAGQYSCEVKVACGSTPAASQASFIKVVA